MKKIITIVVILALLIGGGMVGWKKLTSSTATAVAMWPIVVRTELATADDLVETISASGTVEPRVKVSISAKVSARIVELPNLEGKTVTKGDSASNPPKPASVLVKLDSKDLEANLRSVKARFAAQKATASMSDTRIASLEASLRSSAFSLEDALRDLNRQKGLLSSKDVSQSVVDTAQSKYDQLKAQMDSQLQNLAGEKLNLEVNKHTLEAAEADIAKSQEDLSNTVISSPIDGVVIRLNNQVGEMVVVGITNSAGTTIMEVADLDQMLFVGKIDEAAIANVQKNQKATVHIPAYPKEIFEGIVETVPLANTDDKDGTKYFKTQIKLNIKEKRILSGLSADAEIETHRHEKVIIVPSQSIVGRPIEELPEALRSRPEVDKSKSTIAVVFRCVNGKAVITPVTVGASNATHTVIKSGLSEKDHVITGPFKVLSATEAGAHTIQNDAPVTENLANAPSTQATTKSTTTQASNK